MLGTPPEGERIPAERLFAMTHRSPDLRIEGLACTRLGLAALLALVGISAVARAQQSAALVFAVDERLEYAGRARGVGGRGIIWIEGPVIARGLQSTEEDSIRFAISGDRCRLPVRIESDIPGARRCSSRSPTPAPLSGLRASLSPLSEAFPSGRNRLVRPFLRWLTLEPGAPGAIRSSMGYIHIPRRECRPSPSFCF